MAVRSFIPWAEQLESKLLLAAIPANDAVEAVNSDQFLPAAEQSGFAALVDRSSVMFSSERDGNGYLLVVRLTDSQPPRLVRILGGDSGRTHDGIARLQIAPHRDRIDVAISDVRGEYPSWFRLELSADGQIVSWQQLSESNGDHGKMSEIVFALNHSTGTHPRDTANGLFSGYDDWSHDPGVSLGHDAAMNGRTVDQVIAHADGMAMAWENSELPHSEGNAEFTNREHSADSRVPPQATEPTTDQVAEHVASEASQGASIAGANIAGAVVVAAATLESNSDALPAQGDESFETVVAGWTTGPVPDSAPVARVNPFTPASSREMERVDVATDDRSTMNATVFASFMTDVPVSMPTAEEPAGNSWPIFGALLVSAAAAAGSFALQRRAYPPDRPLPVHPAGE